jgi:hypothetical protein
MNEETTVYCGSCGGALSATARFCRACGTSQEDFSTQEVIAAPTPGPAAAPPASTSQPAPQPPAPQPLAPSPGTWPQSRPNGNRAAAVLAIAGGIGMCFMVLYAIVYLPLHYDAPINFGEPLYFGDLLVMCSGAVAIALGVLALRRAPSRPGRAGAVLILAGLPSLILVVFWAFPETFNLDYYFSKPIYFGFVYFSPLGKTHIGAAYENGYIQIPLLVSSAAVLVGGCLMAFARGRRTTGPSWQ